jgi:hypothetical protein
MKLRKNVYYGHDDSSEPFEIYHCPYHKAEELSDNGFIDDQIKNSERRIVILQGKEPEVQQLFEENGYSLQYGTREQ